MKKKTLHTKSSKHKSKRHPEETDDGKSNAAAPAADPITNILSPASHKSLVKKPRGKEKVHYVNGREFEEEIRVYYNTDFISIKLGESITKIAQGLSYAPNFINYSYKDDMIGDAIVKMVAALKNKKFKLDSGFSPFSYFTTIAFHAFINRIKKEKKHHETVTNYRDRVYTDLMTSHDSDASYHIYVDPSPNNDDNENYNSSGN
jgi:hypothetical protein